MQEEGDSYDWPRDVESAVRRLRQALDEYQQHSSTLRSLFDLVVELDSVIEVNFRQYCRPHLYS